MIFFGTATVVGVDLHVAEGSQPACRVGHGLGMGLGHVRLVRVGLVFTS